MQASDGANILVSTFADVKDSGAFVSTSQLLRVETDFFTAALLARLIDDGVRLHVLLGDGLHLGSLRTQRRGKCVRFGASHDRLGRSI